MANGRFSLGAPRSGVPVPQASLTQRVLAQRPLAPTIRDRFLAFDWSRFLRNSFIACVVLPVAAAAVYTLFIATPTYVAEARFTVRGAADRPLIESYMIAGNLDALPSPSADRTSDGKGGRGEKGAKGKGSKTGQPGTAQSQGGMAGGGARAAQIATLALGAITGGPPSNDPFVVANFIHSADIVRSLDADGWLRQRFAGGDPDWFQSLPANASIERLTRYWQGSVTAALDINTNLLTLSVTAFTAEDAEAIAERVVAQSDALVNRMAERARRDRLDAAEAEVVRQQTRYLAAEGAMRDLRGQDAIIDPKQQAQSSFQLLLQLISARIALDVQLRVLEPSLSPDAPQIRSLRKQIAALDAEIAKAKAALTDASGNTDAAANYLASFERAETERRLSELLYSAALDAQERTRLEAERQASYLAVFAEPLPPAHAAGPKIFSSLATVFLVAFLFWGVLALTVAASRDHLS